MNDALIECIPNVSEGRDPAKLGALAGSIREVSGVSLLHVDSGFDANRTVFTFVGAPERVCEAAFRLAKCTAELLDMRMHSGTHPRIGALDVCPLVPLSGISAPALVPFVNDLGRRIGDELKLPVYLYEQSARLPERRALSYLRRGQYEGLKERLTHGSFDPDFGPREFNPTFGAMVLGVRDFLIAYNVSLETLDVEIAKHIAAQIRERTPRGGEALERKYALAGVKAIGWDAPRFNCVQVSTNITKPDEAGLFEVFQTIERLALEAGTAVLGSELVGLVPLKVLLDAAHELDPDLTEESRAIRRIIEHLRLSTHRPFVAQERVLELILKNASPAK